MTQTGRCSGLNSALQVMRKINQQTIKCCNKNNLKMEYSCCFCSKTEEETPLIELSSNLLFIGKSHFDFSHVFFELFKINVSDDLQSSFICEICKDSVVQFFIFKANVACHVNRHRKMIISQVDDFLSQSKSIQDIQVVRKLHSITLQIDENVVKRDEDDRQVIIYKPEQKDEEDVEEKFVDDFDYEEVISETELEDDEIIEEIDSQIESKQKDEDEMVIVSKYLPCLKCGSVSTSNKTSEIHEFFKHSLLGIQVENEVENSQEFVEVDSETKFIGKCATCLMEFDDSNSLLNHLVLCHSFEILLNINETFAIDTSNVNFDLVNKYIEFIKDLIQTKELDEKADDVIKSYFYQFYSGDELKSVEPVDSIEVDSDVDNEIIFDDPEFTQEVSTVNPALTTTTEKPLKRTVKNLKNLSEESRKWLRNEINLRKNVSKNEYGVSRVLYRCAYCVFSSNSAPGFRYHMASKHLKDNKLEDLKLVDPDLVIPTSTRMIAKNTCRDCNLKFKDHKLFEAHRNYHDLFIIVSEHYSFPACRTCSKLFIDESTLNLHLAAHDTNENIVQPIAVPPGAFMIQGKTVDCLETEPVEEIPDDEFSWNCGHCARKFHREISCRLHLLLVHAGSFLCPIDKREFLGFKAVSLFSHHLKNKHSELFPEITFVCTLCKMEFSSIYDKLSHMKSCSSKKFSCDHCGKKFFKKGDLSGHLKFVTGELYFQCKVCQKKCETVSDMKIHLRSHTKEKPFPCSICNKSFRTLAARSTHMESHNTSVFHTCHCGKTFKQRQMFRRHMKAVHESDDKSERLSTLLTRSKFQVIDEESV